MMDELTQREKQAAQFASIGCTNKQVAEHMSIKESTVKQYLYRVYDKVGIGRRSELASLSTLKVESPK